MMLWGLKLLNYTTKTYEGHQNLVRLPFKKNFKKSNLIILAMIVKSFEKYVYVLKSLEKFLNPNPHCWGPKEPCMFDKK
jgi:hypothetical protein